MKITEPLAVARKVNFLQSVLSECYPNLFVISHNWRGFGIPDDDRRWVTISVFDAKHEPLLYLDYTKDMMLTLSDTDLLIRALHHINESISERVRACL